MVILTPRERDVLRLIVTGKSSIQIAHDLYVSPETVRKYVGRLYRKLEVNNRVQCVVKATRLGLV